MTGDRITIRKVTSKNPKSVSKLSNFNCRFYFIIWNHITEEHAFYTFIHLENTYIVQKVTKKRNSTVRFGKGWDHLDLVHFLQVLDNLVLGHQNIIQFGSPAVPAWGASHKLVCTSDCLSCGILVNITLYLSPASPLEGFLEAPCVLLLYNVFLAIMSEWCGLLWK